ncbi:MAG: alpha/beta hydrolase family protein [Candidatus Sericytochromatia bacterium]
MTGKDPAMTLLARVLLSACLLVAPTEAALAASPAPAAAPSVAAAERWQGELKAGAMTIRLNVRLIPGPDGTYTGTLDVPDQGATGLPLDHIEVSADRLAFGVERIGVRFEGRREPGGRAIAGEWRQGGAALPLTLTSGVADRARKPQEPRPPFPYRAEAVTYTNPADGAKLAGTLTLPEGQGPFPVALLITGSGAQDRDETLFGHKPFWLIADTLTRRGVAVLRVDDRGVGGSTGTPQTDTTDTFAGDVAAGVAFLRGRRDIDPARVGLVGHSEGGIIAPMVAARDPKLAYVVLLAGSGVPGADITVRQVEAIARGSGQPEAVVAEKVKLQRAIMAALVEEKDPARARARLRPLLVQAGLQGDALDQQLDALMSPWFRRFVALDPRVYLARVNCPVLALNGALDTQVDATVNLGAIARALGHNRDVTTRALPGLNHLFQTARTGLVEEYGQIDETFAPAALTLMADWVVAKTWPQAPSK